MVEKGDLGMPKPMEVDSVVSEKSGNGDKKAPDTKEAFNAVVFEDLKEQCKWIERGESNKEHRYVNRVLRQLVSTRKKLNSQILRKLVELYFTTPALVGHKNVLLELLPPPVVVEEHMEVDKPVAATVGQQASGTQVGKSPKPRRPASAPTLLADVDSFIHLLLLLFFLDRKDLDKCEKIAALLMDRVSSLNRRSMDPISAKIFYYYSLLHERLGRLHSIRDFLLASLRTATLRHDVDSQATLINCLLRSYVTQNAYETAGKLVAKVTFPEGANNNEWARFLYYLGRIRAMQLDYGAAHKHLLQALRKAPQHTAVGFKQSAQKLAIVVELLLGEIPERAVFRQPMFRKCLQPYFSLTQVVRAGDLTKFNTVLEKHADAFERDNTYSLIVRLAQNVIRTAVKQIALAYSRISVEDVQKKLALSSPDDAKYIISKVVWPYARIIQFFPHGESEANGAIKEGAVEAVLNSDHGWMQSQETQEVYSTADPQQQFHKRITFCLEIYNQSVKDRRDREQLDLEFAREMAEEDDEDFS